LGAEGGDFVEEGGVDEADAFEEVVVGFGDHGAGGEDVTGELVSGVFSGLL